MSRSSFFEQLPLEVREKFNHNFGEFISSMDSKDFVQRMGWKQPEPAKVDVPVSSNPEVCVNEQK